MVTYCPKRERGPRRTWPAPEVSLWPWFMRENLLRPAQLGRTRVEVDDGDDALGEILRVWGACDVV